ncbi:hypothetical protein RBG11_004208 [Vibrio parahaemolyticus]|nr:hypothetical protein [Vibrio parahaemolyticus]
MSHLNREDIYKDCDVEKGADLIAALRDMLCFSGREGGFTEEQLAILAQRSGIEIGQLSLYFSHIFDRYIR